MFLTVIFICLKFNSMIGGIYMIVSSGLLLSHSVDIRHRNKAGLYVMAVQAFFILLFIIYKLIKANKIVAETTDKLVFLKQYRFLTSLGFDITCEPDLPDNLLKDDSFTGVCKTIVNKSTSFSLELCCSALLIYCIWRLWSKHKSLTRLQETKRSKFRRLDELENP